MRAVKKLENFSRQSWLAGIGAYNTSWDAATDKLDKFYVDGNAFVQSLMERGETLESTLSTKVRTRTMIDEKIAALRAKLGMQKTNKDQQLESLSAKVDNLIEVVAKLAEQKAAEKAAAKSATESKPATKTTRTRKPAASKTATAKAPVAKASTTKKAATKAPAKPRAKAAPKAAE